MRYRIQLWVMAAAVALCAATGAWAQDRIVFADLERVFNEFDKTQLADAQLKKQAGEFQQEREGMVEELETMRERFNVIREEARNEALSESVRTERRNEYEEMALEIKELEVKIRRYDELRAKQLEDQGRRMRKGIVEEIQTAIQSIARQNGYAAVLDRSGQSLNGIEAVLYVDPRYDITDAVIAELNKVE
jgi:outer membrane protein